MVDVPSFPNENHHRDVTNLDKHAEVGALPGSRTKKPLGNFLEGICGYNWDTCFIADFQNIYVHSRMVWPLFFGHKVWPLDVASQHIITPKWPMNIHEPLVVVGLLLCIQDLEQNNIPYPQWCRTEVPSAFRRCWAICSFSSRCRSRSLQCRICSSRSWFWRKMGCCSLPNKAKIAKKGCALFDPPRLCRLEVQAGFVSEVHGFQDAESNHLSKVSNIQNPHDIPLYWLVHRNPYIACIRLYNAYH